MASKNFASGTLIDSAWLNDVNKRTYQDFIDVTSDGYGAVGDGSTDDTTAIQNALNTGKDVFLPYTTNYYKLTAALQFTRNGQRIFSFGLRPQLRQTTSDLSVIESIGFTDTVVDGLELYCVGTFSALRTGAGVVFDGADRGIAQNCHFKNCRGWALQAYNGSDDCIFINNFFTDAPTSGITDDTDIGGDIQVVYGSKRAIISGNSHTSGSGSAIKVQTVVDPDNNDASVICANSIKGYKIYGIVVYRNSQTLPIGQSLKSVVITGNVIDGISGEVLNSISGTYTYGAGIYSQGCEDVIITANNIRNTHTAAVSFSSTLAPGAIGVTNQSRFVVSNNIIENAGFNGMDVGDANAFGESLYGAIIDNNIITNCTLRGIRVRTLDGLRITNNVVNTTGSTSIEVNLSTTTTVTNYNISHNTCSNGASGGIIGNYINRLICVGNIVDNMVGGGLSFANTTNIAVNFNMINDVDGRGIHVTSTCTGSVVTNNKVIGNGTTTEAIRFDALTAYHDNIVSNSVALYAGSFAPGSVTVASAANIDLPYGVHMVLISGTTNITSITATGHQGTLVTLRFAGALTFTDGSNLKLNGNFVTSADDTITLVCDGTNWYEVSRSAN